MRSPRKVAVFDIDGTIFRSSLLIESVEALIASGEFPASATAVYDRAHRAWLDRRGSYEEYIAAVVTAFDTHIRGVKEGDFLKVVKAMIATHRHRVYRYTRDLARELDRKGYFLLAISHSPKYLVDRFAKQMGFDKVYGRLLELDPKGRFTGAAFHMQLLGNKAVILKRAIEKEGLTLKGSVGVGDTESDIAFLELVERPICFNPNRLLYDAARKRGWEVVVERKDVIYDIFPK